MNTSRFNPFRRTHVLPVRTSLAAMCALVLFQAHGQTTIIQTFDGFADTASLNAIVSGATANTTVTLGAADGVGGSQALNFQGANGSSPYYSQFTLNIAPFSLTGLSDVTLAAEFLGGSNEKLEVELLDANSVSLAAGPQVGTQSIPNSSFTSYTIAFSGLTSTVNSLRFTFVPSDYGTTGVAIDNIATVAAPEPGSLAIAGLALSAFLFRKSR